MENKVTQMIPTSSRYNLIIQHIQGLLQQPHPFSYPLAMTLKQSTSAHTNVMVCFHGYGGSHRFIAKLQRNKAITDNLISFNFPDFDSKDETLDPHATTFGTIDELLPALYVLKKCILDGGLKTINLYGFSAGGAAIINAIGVLNQDRFNHELATIGITAHDKKTILQAIQSGYIILDCPLKSIEEIIDFRGTNHMLTVLAQRYEEHDFVPIKSLRHLKGLTLNLMVHFQIPDEILSNRDDTVFIQKLQDTNQLGKTMVIFGNDGGHNTTHTSLWDAYQKFIKASSS